jgi:arylsulfatase A-like enzyme
VITRRSFLAASAAAVVKPRRPNVLLILPDQLRACALAYMGDPNVRSPHIDKLASEGLVFRNMIANTPVCCPARANLLTGKYAHKNGMTANDLRLRESEVTLSSILHDAGYRTGFIGKWHLDGGPRMPGFIPPGPRRHGFEYWAANECSHAHFNTQYFRDTDEPIPIRKFEPEVWTDLAIGFLREKRSDTRPFFLAVEMGPPHDPYRAPAEYSKMYDAAKLKLRPNYQPGEGIPSPRLIAEQYAMITEVDDQVGRLMAELASLQLANDTIVVFTSDHGDMLGSQGQRLKRKPWDESIRVPGIIRYPDRVAHGATDTFFTHVDFAPTMLGLCGLRPPASMQGVDLSGVVTGKGGRGPDDAFLQIFGPFHGDGTEAGWRGVRTQRYTYARYQDRPWVLYDDERDPYQMRNLAADPGSRPLLAEMERRVKTWMERTGDSWSNDWTYPVEDNGRLYRNGAYYSVNEYLKTL